MHGRAKVFCTFVEESSFEGRISIITEGIRYRSLECSKVHDGSREVFET